MHRHVQKEATAPEQEFQGLGGYVSRLIKGAERFRGLPSSPAFDFWLFARAYPGSNRRMNPSSCTGALVLSD